MMDFPKQSRRSKWLAKVFRREDSGSSRSTPSAQISRDEQQNDADRPGPASQDGTTRQGILSTSHAKVESSESHSGTTLPQSSDHQDFEEKVILSADQQNIKQDSTTLNSPQDAQKVLKPSAKGVLAAPALPSNAIAGSNSPFKKINQVTEEKKPRLLDPTASMRTADLWGKAYSQLSKDENHKDLFMKYEAILEESLPSAKSETSFPKRMDATVQFQINKMKQKQWVLQWDQKSIVVRDQAERIVKFVQTFSNLGTAIASIDPVHAGIPWAGVCTILTLILNDSTQHQAALDGLEEISSIIAKYIAIEDVYVQSCEVNSNPEFNTVFEASIIKVYSSVLRFQVEAALHFHRPTMARTVSNIVKSVDWKGLLSKVQQCDAACVDTTSVSGIANVTSGISKISQSLSDLEQKWEEILDMSKTFEKLQEDWEEKQTKNAKVISWISDMQVGEDHERVRTKLGHRYWDAGQWFLQNPEFKKWKRSPRGQFWLQGSVGTGKTSLASIVINELVKTYDDRSVAFYYCSRGLAATSNNPTAIFRSLVAQLGCTSDGEEIYQVIKDWYNRDAKRFVTGSRLSLEECENLLVTLMGKRGKTVIVVDGIDECTEPMQLLRSLHHIWESYKGLMVFVTSRLDVSVSEIFPKISTVQSDFGKTSDDIREYIKTELQREERRNAKVITDELAERMVNILTQRAQGMFRWVELQLDLLISPERRIKYRRDFEDRLKKLEHGSGQEVLDSLRETYDDIYERNTQGPHSQRLAEKSLKWVLCAARPLKIWELGAAVSVDGEDVVTTDLIVDICSNFFMVDPRGFVQLAHLSVREYLEVKNIGGRLIFSPEEAHAEAAFTCLLYWKTLSQQRSARQNDDDKDDDDDLESIYARSDKQAGAAYIINGPSSEGDLKKFEQKSLHWGSTVARTSDDEADNDTDTNQPPVDILDRNTKVTTSSVEVASQDVESDPDAVIDDLPIYHAPGKAPAIIPTIAITDFDESIDGRTDRYREEADLRVQGSEDMSYAETATEERDPVLEEADSSYRELEEEDVIKIVTPATSSPYDAPPTGDYFDLADSYIRIDSAPSLNPRRAFKRFQRYASIYWATHCQAAKTLRTDESRALNEPFWEFLGDDGCDPAFRLWAKALLNETKLASLPTIDPAPMIFVPATGHGRAILDSEPMYERWQEVVAHVEGAQPLMPSVPLIACFYGFTDILQEISEEGEAQTTRSHEGIMGLVLAARNGWNEILDLPISQDFDLDIPDKEGRTALHHAALGGYLELARFLLGYPRKPTRRGGKKEKDRKPRASINTRDLGKRTPLHYAAAFQQVEVLKLLLAEDNIDVHVRNHYGLTALGLCPLDSEVAKILRADSRYEKADEL